MQSSWPTLPPFGILLLVALCPVCPAQADTPSSYKTMDVKQYGNCVVKTSVDMFTDEDLHEIFCHEEILTDETTIGVARYQTKGLLVSLSTGVQLYLEDDRVPVAIRIDEGPLIRRDASWVPPKVAVIDDEQLAHSFLHDLAHGQHVAVQVGDEYGRIRLAGARRAIEDFRQRAGLPPQQTLTLPGPASP